MHWCSQLHLPPFFFMRGPLYFATSDAGFVPNSCLCGPRRVVRGGVTGLPGLTEMITNYVILSRLRRADSLLLMRAFSPTLFRHGSPPGPYCLQKLLRSRFSSNEQTQPTKSQTFNAQEGTHEEVYTTEEAMREYKRLSGEWDARKKCNAP